MFASIQWVKDLVKKCFNKAKNDGYFNQIIPARANGVHKLLTNGPCIGIGGTMSFYIDGTNGNDTTGNGTQDKPFKTMSYVRTQLPKITPDTSEVRLYISGDFVDDRFIFYNIPYQLNIYFVDNPTFTYTEKNTAINPFAFSCVQSVHVQSGNATIDISKSQTTNSVALYVLCSNFRFNAGSTLTLIGNKTYKTRGVFLQRSKGAFLGTVISTNQNIGAYSNQCSQIYLSNLQGTGNDIGIRVDEGSTLAYNTKTIAATTAQVTGSGGRIYTGA